jgi:hypothetical protein
MSTTRNVVVIDHDDATLEMLDDVLQRYNPVLYHDAKLKPEDLRTLGTAIILLDWSYRTKEEALTAVSRVCSLTITESYHEPSSIL